MIILVVAAVLAFIFLMSRIGDLEDKVQRLEQKPGAKNKRPVATLEQKPVAVPPQTVQAPPTEVRHTESEDRFAKVVDGFLLWLKTDWLMKLGALFLILALAWFVSYSFMQGWIGPVGRITLGISAGAGFLLWGYYLMNSKFVPGQVIVIVGTTTIFLTVFAAREIYDFFTPALALGIMALTVALTATIAIVHNTLALALVALIGGAAAPLFTASPSPDYVALLAYIFILDLGILAIVALRGWRSLIFLGLIVTGLYSQAFWQMEPQAVWIFMGLFSALFLFASNSAIWRSKKALIADLITVVLAVILAITWIAEFVPGHWQSLVSAGLAASAVSVSYLLWQRGAPSAAVYTHGAAAVALLGAATIFELEGEALAIAFFAEVTGLLLVARFVMKDLRAVHVVAWLYVIPLLLSLESLDYWRELGMDFAVVMVATIAFGVGAWITYGFSDEKNNASLIAKAFSILAALFAVALVWRFLEVVIDSRSYAHGAALVIYTIIGVALFFRGNTKAIPMEKTAGIALLTAVTLRLLLVEVWIMSIGGRIVTFMLIGALFISTAFFKKNKDERTKD